MQTFDTTDLCVEKVLERVGKKIVLAIPLAAGKPNQFVNALYNRAKRDSSIKLKIVTALTLNKPQGKSLLEKNFLDPFVERVFGEYPNLEYEIDRQNNSVPKNIEIMEFYFRAGIMMNNCNAQENYISSNYTHVARDLMDAGVNVIAQIVSPSSDGRQFSLGCNPDVSLDIMESLEGQTDFPVAFVAQVNHQLPFMYGDALVNKDKFHFVIDHPSLDFKIFSTPKMSVSDVDHLIGLYASTLVKDNGELQVGIGSLGDALVYSLLMRHEQNEQYHEILSHLDIKKKFSTVIGKKGNLDPFQLGLFGATEMMVDVFMHLIDRGIVKRRVYDHLILQRLLNEKLITEKVTAETLFLLLERGVIRPKLRQKDFEFLIHFGIFKEDLEFKNGRIILNNGESIEVDLNIDEISCKIVEHCLGQKLKNGAIIHAGFFLGEQRFYQWLRDLPEEQLRQIHMKSVTKINQLYGHEELDRLHRKNARFINTCLLMTLSGSAVSDGLEDGRVISGVGGQYNFVSMAQALPDGYSILQLRSTRSKNSKLSSNIVFNYGHITIPRHLRDIVITEYGIADLRGKTDSEVAAALIEIADSRFQSELISKAQAAGKLKKTYRLPERFKTNLPEELSLKLQVLKEKGFFPKFPFGCDFTEEELAVGAALKSLKSKMESKAQLAQALLATIWAEPKEKHQKYLQRMKLEHPNNFIERLYQKLLINELDI